MEELAREAEVALDAVDRVTRHGQVDRGQMHADLVRPPRLEGRPEEGVPAHRLDHFEVRDGVARGVGVQGDPRRVVPVTADRRLDAPPLRARPAAHEGQVLAHELSPPQELL